MNVNLIYFTDHISMFVYFLNQILSSFDKITIVDAILAHDKLLIRIRFTKFVIILESVSPILKIALHTILVVLFYADKE